MLMHSNMHTTQEKKEMSDHILEPPKLYRLINYSIWDSAMKSIMFGNYRLNHMIVSWHHTGWVYIVTVDANKVFSCLTYKIAGTPEAIKNDLYNFTIINGNLINSERYVYTNKTFSRL